MRLNISICAILFFLQATEGIGQTPIGGVVSANTTLTAIQSPYLVTNNLLVQEGITLTIEPGVILKFEEGIYLQIDGELRAVGTPTDTIVFTKNDNVTEGWRGLNFTPLAVNYDAENNSGCILSYCRIEHSGNFAGPSGWIVQSMETDLLIDNCDIRYFHQGINFDLNSSVVRNCKIHDGQYFALIAYRGSLDKPYSIYENEIYNTDGNNNPAIHLHNSIFESNHIHDTQDAVVMRVTGFTAVKGNSIEDNDGIAIQIRSGSNHAIVCNTFENNDIHTLIQCERHPLFRNNNLLSFTDHAVYWAVDYENLGTPTDCPLPPGSGQYATIDLSSNYWGGLTGSQIDDAIWDFNDDFSLKALIEYSPVIPNSIDMQTADCTYVIPLGVKQSIQVEELLIFPNPSMDGKFTIRNSQITNIDVYNLVGQSLIHTNSHLIDISNYSHGVYLVKVDFQDGKVGTAKLIYHD